MLVAFLLPCTCLKLTQAVLTFRVLQFLLGYVYGLLYGLPYVVFFSFALLRTSTASSIHVLCTLCLIIYNTDYEYYFLCLVSKVNIAWSAGIVYPLARGTQNKGRGRRRRQALSEAQRVSICCLRLYTYIIEKRRIPHSPPHSLRIR